MGDIKSQRQTFIPSVHEVNLKDGRTDIDRIGIVFRSQEHRIPINGDGPDPVRRSGRIHRTDLQVGLAQVGRQSDGTMPSLAELRGSGDLEQDADNVIFLHRPSSEQDKYVHPADRALFPALKENGLQYIAIHVAKQRQGPIGTVATIFNPGRMLYTMIQRQPPRPQQPETEDDEDSDE